jgi:hypothetical protein
MDGNKLQIEKSVQTLYKRRIATDYADPDVGEHMISAWMMALAMAFWGDQFTRRSSVMSVRVCFSGEMLQAGINVRRNKTATRNKSKQHRGGASASH